MNECRDILDCEGNVIGKLKLPQNTPEHVWESLLSLYEVEPIEPIEPPPQPLPQES